jgi:sugar-phosphatase
LSTRRAVLLDVDGTLLDVLPNLRRVWTDWAQRHELDPELVWRTALVTHPLGTFARVAPALDPDRALKDLHELEDEDARSGSYVPLEGAGELLDALASADWALVTGNYAHRVRTRFERLRLPLPRVIVDAGAVTRGKPHPEGYLKAAEALGLRPDQCLSLEDGEAGMAAARRAGTTVWAVNVGAEGADLKDADRVYPTLKKAVNDILEWLGGVSGSNG